MRKYKTNLKYVFDKTFARESISFCMKKCQMQYGTERINVCGDLIYCLFQAWTFNDDIVLAMAIWNKSKLDSIEF